MYPEQLSQSPADRPISNPAPRCYIGQEDLCLVSIARRQAHFKPWTSVCHFWFPTKSLNRPPTGPFQTWTALGLLFSIYMSQSPADRPISNTEQLESTKEKVTMSQSPADRPISNTLDLRQVAAYLLLSQSPADRPISNLLLMCWPLMYFWSQSPADRPISNHLSQGLPGTTRQKMVSIARRQAHFKERPLKPLSHKASRAVCREPRLFLPNIHQNLHFGNGFLSHNPLFLFVLTMCRGPHWQLSHCYLLC